MNATGKVVTTDTHPPDRWVGTWDVGRLFGVTAQSAKKWMRAGRLPARRLPSGFWRCRWRDAVALFEGQPHTIPAPRVETAAQRAERAAEATKAALA